MSIPPEPDDGSKYSSCCGAVVEYMADKALSGYAVGRCKACGHIAEVI